MDASDEVTVDIRHHEPWFAQHSRYALAVAVGSSAAIFALHLSVADEDTAALYVLPVALTALAFGLWPGTLAGITTALLTVLATAIDHESLTVPAWFSHLAPQLLLGSLVGASANRVHDARRAERFAMAVALLQRDTAEANDSVLQGLAVARWLLESGRVEPAIKAIDSSAATAQHLVSRILGKEGVLPDQLRNPHRVIHPPTDT